MLVSTEAISLNYVKYSETSIIVKCFTKSDGLKSYLLKGILTSKKKKINAIFHFGEFSRIYQSFLNMGECINSNAVGSHAIFNFCLNNKIIVLIHRCFIY